MGPFISISLLALWLVVAFCGAPVRPVLGIGGATAASAMVGVPSFVADPFRDPVSGHLTAATEDDTLEIASFGIELSYDVTEIRATAGDTLTIRYDNSESEMTHNIVFVRSEEDIVPVGNAALDAYRNDYIPHEEKGRIIAHSRLLYPGESDTFSFVVPPPGTYPYICTYSGHFTMMQGRLISTD